MRMNFNATRSNISFRVPQIFFDKPELRTAKMGSTLPRFLLSGVAATSSELKLVNEFPGNLRLPKSQRGPSTYRVENSSWNSTLPKVRARVDV